jgi:GntR family transcriptional regulator
MDKTDQFVHFRDQDKIDLESVVPYYHQLKQLIKARIVSGEWESGQKLPSEKELCESFDVSRSVVRQALGELSTEGLIDTYRAKGSFVARAIPKYEWRLMESLSGFYEDAVGTGKQVFAHVLEFRITNPSEKVALILEMDQSENIILLKRLRFIGNEPVMLGITHLPEYLCPNLINEDMRNRSLYRLLAEKYGMSISKGQRTIESVNATTEQAGLLNVEIGAALSLIKGTMYLEDNIPLEYGESWHRGDRSKFQVGLFNPV